MKLVMTDVVRIFLSLFRDDWTNLNARDIKMLTKANYSQV
jgi:hypothetical protein